MNWTTWNEKTKAKYVEIAKKHREADRFIQGTWLREGKDKEGMHRGCFFGCIVQKSDDVLKTAWTEMQLPEWLVAIAEKIFEGLSKEEAVEWPVVLLEAIPCNKDALQLYKDWNIALLTDQLQYCKYDAEVIRVVKMCIDLSKVGLNESTAWSAESAAWSAESARYAERDAPYQWQRDTLLNLLKTL